MKPDARQTARLLQDPSAQRTILLYGEDAGLIRERATQAVRAAAGSLDDPFRVAALNGGEHDRLIEEAGALSLTGGRRVVWVRDAGDALVPALRRVFAGPAGALLVLEAAGLPSRAKLRALVEGLPDGAAIACYPEEGRALEAAVTRMLGEQGVRIAPDALHWLTTRLGSDRAMVRGEVEKLALFADPDHPLDLEDVSACIGDAGDTSLEDAAFAAMAGDRATADAALERALAEGTSPVAMARTLLGHVHRLRQARAMMQQSGSSAADAAKALRPPVFFKRVPSFVQALSLWSLDGLEQAAERTLALELACKQGGGTDLVQCRRHLAALSGEARKRR